MVRIPMRPRCAVPALLALGVLVAAPLVVAAQERSAPGGLRRIQDVEPLSGPPGTRVRVHTENMPLQARVHVGVGATRFGFEERGEARQGEWGVIDGWTTIPETATWDRPVVIILFNAIFSPIGISEPFHVTNADGEIRRTGQVVAVPAGGCPQMRDGDGYLYSLRGDVGAVTPGDTLVVEGTWEGAEGCVRGNTIRVSRVGSRGPAAPVSARPHPSPRSERRTP